MTMSRHNLKTFLAALFLLGALSVGAITQAQAASGTYKSQEMSDPIEPVNRFIFGFNDILDRLLIEPIAKGYNAVLPQFVRDSVQSFMRNLNSPVIIANNLLQGKIGDAGTATARFVINSTVGVAGLVDVASSQGLKHEDRDFSQTLGTWGVGNGFYLVLPVLGPSSLRDTAGMLVDSYADPVRIYADNTDRMWIYYTRVGIEGIDHRSRLIKPIDDMRRNSLDYYAAARSAYKQRRESLINGEKPDAAGYSTLNSTDHP
jgi:phospholipid-binding lipoprotein MlaA